MSSGNEQHDRVQDYYRRVMDGHVFMRDTINALLEVMDQRIQSLGRPLRILELGCHAGVSTQWFLERWPDAEFVVQDERDDLIAIGRERLAGRRVEFHHGHVASLQQSFDMVVSIARHHHLPHDYLDEVLRALKPGGVYTVAEELCPEYCAGEHAERVANAEILHIAGGYVLTSRAEAQTYKESGTLPAHVRDLERLRRRALWRWYRFVVDYAVQHDYFDIAVAELQSTQDDLMTGSDAEHKFSPMIVERQFALAGFQRLSRRIIGPPDKPELQSMIVYEFGRT